MIEAVGWQYFDEFFRRCDELLSRRRADAAAGDHDRRPTSTRSRRARAASPTPTSSPAAACPRSGLIADCLARVTEHAPGLDRRHHRPLPADPGRLARALPRRLGAAARRAATTSASAASGTSTSAPRRRASASGGSATCRRSSRSRGGGERAGGREPLLLIHGLGGSAARLGAGDRRCSRPSARCSSLDMPGFGAAPPLPDGVEPTAANLAAALHEACAASSGSSARTSPATRSAAGSGWRWAAPAGPPRSPRSPPPGSGGRRSAPRARATPRALGAARCARWSRSALRSPGRARGAMLSTFAAHPERIPRRRPAASWSSAGSTPAATTAPTGRCAPTSSTRPATRRTCR